MDSDDDNDFIFESGDESGDGEEIVELENQYYNAKSLKESSYEDALEAFQTVLDTEGDNKGDWGFKALKQMIKCCFKLEKYEKMMAYYKKLLTYIRSAVTKNYSEKSIKSILDNISTAKDFELLNTFYETTLNALKETKNDRLWFKTNLKLAKLYFDMQDYLKLQKILKELYASCLNTQGGDVDSKKGTQLLEVYAIEIQMCTEQKNNKKLKELYQQTNRIQCAISHPDINGIIRECGGKMYLRQGQFEEAATTFFEAFKNYDESGNPRRLSCLKYLVLANMLMKSTIDPFESQEAKPYKDDPQIVIMQRLVSAYQKRRIYEFQRILDENDAIMMDSFVHERIKDLIYNIRVEVILRLVEPYSVMRLSFIADELRITADEVSDLLVLLIQEEKLFARIDQVDGLLIFRDTDEFDTEQCIGNWANSLRVENVSSHLSLSKVA